MSSSVAPGGGLHQSLTQLLDLACVRSGNRDLCSLAALGLVCDVVNNVDNAGAVGHGDGDSADDAAVLCLECVEHCVVVAMLLIALGDAESGGDVCGLEVLPGALCADGDTVLCRAEDDACFNCADSCECFTDEVEVAGAVKNVDLAAAELDRRDRCGYGYLALDLFCVIVADGVAVADLTLTVDSAGGEEHALSQTGFAAVAVPQQADVANVFGFVAHLLLPLCWFMCACMQK